MKRFGILFTTCVLLLSFAIIAQGQTTESLLDSVINGSSSVRYSLVGTTSGLDVSEETALTNTVHPLVDFTHTTSGAPANGIGLSLRWLQETAAANTENGANIAVIATDTTAASEDFQIDLQLMTGGASPATKWSLGSTGIVTLVGGTTLDNTTASTLTVTETNIGLTGATTVTGALVTTAGADPAEETALTNTVHPLVSLTHTTSGAPANGIGVSTQYIQETSAGNNEIGAVTAAIVTDSTLGSEDFQFDWQIMTGGATAATKMSLGSTGILTLVNSETIDNSVNGTITYTATTHDFQGNVTSSGSVDIVGAGGLILENDETITNTANGVISVDGTFDITAAGGLVLSNDETITNAVNGAVVVDGSFEATDFIAQNAAQTAGLLTLHTTTATSGALTGATDKIEVDIPSGALLFACQLNVDVAVTNAGDNTWGASYSGGNSAVIIAAGTGAAAKNTKVNTFYDANAATAITSGETDITLTPQGADFTAGEITAVCYYYTLTSMDDET